MTPTSSKILFLLCIVTVFGCRDSEPDNRKWYKGNLHTHSYWSDGDEFPEMIMDWYKSKGYNFVGLSDHNILAVDEKWIKVINSRIYEDGFQKYLAKYDSQWVTHKVDSGRILVKLKTYAEYKPLFEDNNFLIIQSEEISDKFEGKPIHINVTNVKERIEPQGGESVSNVMQRNVDAVLEQRKKTGVPMFPHINHPNFFFAVSVQDLIDLRGERFFEVYNGHPMVNNYGDSLRPGTEQMWDMINIAYSNRNQPLIYGLATDDSHEYHQVGSAYSNAGRGWVMVYADSLKPGSLISALENGDFYASTGVTLKEVTVKNNTLTIKIDPSDNVQYTIDFVGVAKGEQQSRVLKSISATEASVDLTDQYLFVRARITSDRIKDNPFKDADVEMAWTQPVVFPARAGKKP
ncbi:MAG TPA: histidinol-phosphatase [Chryseolinea sp.]